MMKKRTLNFLMHLDAIQKKIIFYILLISIPMLTFSLYFIQNSAATELKKFAEQRANTVVNKIDREVKDYLHRTSTFAKQASFMLKLHPEAYRSVLPFLKKEVKNNSNVYGSALALEPSKMPKKKYCKYYYEHNNTVEEKWLMLPNYDYLSQAWFSEVKKHKNGIWSKPYFDKGGGNVFMSTFSSPLLDKENHFFGVITADIKIDKLSQKIQELTYSKESFVFVVDKEGLLLSHPDDHYALKETVFSYAKDIHSETLFNAYKGILTKDKHIYSVTIESQDYTLYSADMPQSDLKIAVFIQDAMLYEPLTQLRQKLLLITFAGIMIILMMVLFILQQFKFDIMKTSKRKSELALAKKIQMSFLPEQKDFITEHFNIHAYLEAAKEIGGDLYGYKELKDSVIFYVGDVSGKGVPAALFMMATQIVLENAIDTTEDPAKVIALTNSKLLELSKNGMFVTLLVVKYNWNDKMLTFCNAGHPTFIVKTTLLFSPLGKFHPPVNTFANIDYKNTFLPIEEPFKLFCFSDGVTEAENTKQVLFGIERVARVLAVKCSVKDLQNSISIFVGNRPANDDITILSFSYGEDVKKM